MQPIKTGEIIKELRIQHGFTQRRLAEKLRVTEQAVSKWERGLGCPDQSLICELADILEVDITALLSGEMGGSKAVSGNIKKVGYYVCPTCNNLILSMENAEIACCGRKLARLTPKKCENELKIEISDNDYYITASHPMENGHYISFVSFINSDTVIMKKTYPEWNLQVRIPMISHGTLLYYCTKHGLFCQDI